MSTVATTQLSDKNYKRNARRTKQRAAKREELRELQERPSFQYIEISTKTAEGNDESKVDVTIREYDPDNLRGSTSCSIQFPKYSTFETIQAAFMGMPILKPSDIVRDGSPIVKKVPRKYTSMYRYYAVTRKQGNWYDIIRKAYDTLMERSNNTWKPVPYDPDNASHEMPISDHEAAYFQLMEETNGKWKPCLYRK